jgi:hypothetical protein
MNLDFVIASVAKQSTQANKARAYGLPRRCAPRNDNLDMGLFKGVLAVSGR